MPEAETADDHTVICTRCGRARTQDPPSEALTWVSERTASRIAWLCPNCARNHVRDIEGKLPVEYW